MRSFLLLVAGALFFPSPLLSQVISGELTSFGDGRALTGAMVVLSDSAGREQARALTDGDGRFIVRAARPGRYRLEAQLIGYESSVSPFLTVGADTLEYAFAVPVDAIELPSIQAVSGARGCARRADGDDVAVLWNEIRKVLNATEWTSQTGRMNYVLRRYRTMVDPARGVVISDERSTINASARLPFETAAPADLAESGFARKDGDDLILHGPDALVLTSAEFLDGHCFRLTAHYSDPGLIGLAFEPVRERDDVVDIEGVLWVDRASAALRRLEYDYTNEPAPLTDHGASAEIRFRPLENGLWIVDSWWIRGPRLVVDGGLRGVVMQRRGFSEDGGVVLRAHDGSRTLHTPAGDAVLEGTVSASPGGEPLPDTRVFLTGTAFEAMSNDRGRYRIEQVPAGRYGVSFSHALNEALHLPIALDSVTLVSGQPLERDFALPLFADIMRTLCPTVDEEPFARALIYGVVRDSAGAAPGIVPRAAWRRDRSGFLGSLTGSGIEHRHGDITDADGRYYLCWVPIDAPLTVEMLMNGSLLDAAEIRGADTKWPLMRLDFDLARKTEPE
ncbi:MAG: carboxypeptidase-like regulatory domain-containing protein [Gemmatimonadota bacterium]